MSGVQERRRTYWRRGWPWLLLAVVVAYSGAHWATRVLPDSLDAHRAGEDRAFLDFDVYFTAARQMAAGRSIYAPTDTLPRPPCVGPETLEYVYTPLLAELLRPWAGMAPCRAEVRTFVVNCLVCAALPPLLVVACGRRRSPAAWALALGLVAAPMATLETVSLGQVNALALMLMLGCVLLADRGRFWPAAVLLALAAALRVTPLALGLIALRPGRRGLLVALAGATAVVMGLVFLGAPDSTPAGFLAALDARAVKEPGQIINASWVAAVARALAVDGATYRRLVHVNVVLVLATAAFAWWRARADAGPGRLTALGFALSAALPPVFEVHHQMLLYPSLMFLVLHVAGAPRAAGRLAGLVGVVLLAALLNSRGLVRVENAAGVPAHLLVKPAGVALWALIAWLLCLRPRSLE